MGGRSLGRSAMTPLRAKRFEVGRQIRARVERKRTPRAERAKEPFAVYRLAVRLPAKAVGYRFSTTHPELRIEVQNRMEVSPRHLLTDGRVLGPRAEESASEWSREVENYPGVTEVDLQVEGPDVAHFRLTQVTPTVHHVMRRHRVLTRFPIVIQDGWMRFETVATSGQMRKALLDLERRVGASHVEAVRKGPAPLGGLGLGRAHEAVFRAAMAAGYFDVPRRISVTGLAARLGRGKSTVSESLAIVEKRLADAALQLALVQVPPTA